MVDCALILAAGENRRMGALVESKAVLAVGQETFLSRHIDALTRGGVRRIFVIASRRAAKLIATYEDARVKAIVSPFDGLGVGSSLSVLCGLECALEAEPSAAVLVMDADVVYEDALMDAVLQASVGRSQLFTIDRVNDDCEEVVVYGRGPDEPVLLGKGLPRSLLHGLRRLGESVGIIYLERHDVRYCRDLIRWLAGAPPGLKGFGYSGPLSEHEEVWQYLFSLRRLGVHQLPKHLLFSECDTSEDYAHICDTLFPAIEQRSRPLGLRRAFGGA